MDKRIGAQYFTIRDFCRDKKGFDESCRRVAEIGYKTVQLSGIGDFEPEFIKEVLDTYGLEAVCTHRPFADFEENFDELVKYHNVTGCRYAGLGCMPGFSSEPEVIDAFVKKYRPIAKRLADSGLTLTYHNHAFEFEKINGRYVFDIIAESVDNMEFILDVYWLSYAGINPVKFIEKYKGKIACVHFKDIAVYKNQIEMAEVMEGNIDWDDVIRACINADVKYAFVEQDVCRRDPFESLKISYDNLHTKGFI